MIEDALQAMTTQQVMALDTACRLHLRVRFLHAYSALRLRKIATTRPRAAARSHPSPPHTTYLSLALRSIFMASSCSM